jgi:AraC-like DNA-binding protein
MFLPFLFSLGHSILEEVSLQVQLPSLNIISSILGVTIFIITFLFIPIILVKTYQIIHSSKNKEEKKWLLRLWLFEVVLLLSWLMTILLSLFIEYEIPDIMHFIALFSTILIHWVAYVGLYKFKLANDQEQIRKLLLDRKIEEKISIDDSYPQVFELTKAVREPSVALKEPKKLSIENNYFQELERLCSDQKIYRDSNLDRDKVAKMLGISPSYVSQLINSITGENFSTYINRYRVEEVKKLIVDKEFENYSLLSMGLECGFSSKTTYYNWFKKITGMTPNTYRKMHK